MSDKPKVTMPRDWFDRLFEVAGKVFRDDTDTTLKVDPAWLNFLLGYIDSTKHTININDDDA